MNDLIFILQHHYLALGCICLWAASLIITNQITDNLAQERWRKWFYAEQTKACRINAEHIGVLREAVAHYRRQSRNGKRKKVAEWKA